MTDFYDWFTTSYFSIFLKVVILSLDAHAKKSAGYFYLTTVSDTSFYSSNYSSNFNYYY